MRTATTFLAIGALTVVMTTMVNAQGLQQPASVEATAFNYDYYAQPTSQPSEVPVAPPDAGSPVYDACGGCGGCDGCDGCGNSCCYDYCFEDPCDCCRWSLFNNSCRSWELGGWISAGGTLSNENPPSKFLTPLAFNDRDEELMLNQLWLYAEKSVEDCCCGWTVGGRMDLMYGADHRFTQAVGLELRDDGNAHWNSSNPSHLYGVAMPQFYGEVGNANASIKFGHYYTPIGYESVPAANNFFYSHAYTMLYGEPFTHTGVLGRYSLSSSTDVYLGVNNKWDTFDADDDEYSVLGGATWTSCDCRMTLSGFATRGKETNNQNVDTNLTMYSLVASYWLNPCLQYVIQHDNGWHDDDGGAGVNAEWYGLNQYLFYTINDCWKAGARFEWFRDDDGTRVPSSGNSTFAGSFYEVTLGANWTPNSNLIVRPELRWDWYDGPGNPYHDETSDDMFTAGVDVYLSF